MKIVSKVTYKGKPIEQSDLKNDIRKISISNLANFCEQKLAQHLTRDEMSKITINITDKPGKGLSCDIQTPSDAIELRKKIDNIMRS